MRAILPATPDKTRTRIRTSAAPDGTGSSDDRTGESGRSGVVGGPEFGGRLAGGAVVPGGGGAGAVEFEVESTGDVSPWYRRSW